MNPQILKISSLESSGSGKTFRLEGHLGGPSVSELHRSCGQVLLQGRQLTLDLAGVSFIDRDGISLLKELKILDVKLRNCSPFVALRLQEGSVK